MNQRIFRDKRPCRTSQDRLADAMQQRGGQDRGRLERMTLCRVKDKKPASNDQPTDQAGNGSIGHDSSSHRPASKLLSPPRGLEANCLWRVAPADLAAQKATCWMSVPTSFETRA